MVNKLSTEVPLAAEPPVIPTPTVTHYQQVANELSAAMQTFKSAIPGYESAHSLTKNVVEQKRRIPEAFVKKAVAALLMSPELQTVRQLDAAESLDDAQFIDALAPVLQQLGTLYDGLKFTIDARKARLAANAQQIYAISRGLAQTRAGADLTGHVEEMKRARRSHPRRRTDVPASPTTTPQA